MYTLYQPERKNHIPHYLSNILRSTFRPRIMRSVVVGKKNPVQISCSKYFSDYKIVMKNLWNPTKSNDYICQSVFLLKIYFLLMKLWWVNFFLCRSISWLGNWLRSTFWLLHWWCIQFLLLHRVFSRKNISQFFPPEKYSTL